MKQLTKLFSLIIAISFLMACNDDDTPPPGGTETTVAEDRANIEATFDEALECIRLLKDGAAVDVLLREFLGLSDGEAFNEDWIEDLTLSLEDVLVLDQIEENQRFDISQFAGTYTYNLNSESWVRVNDQNNRVVFRFPSSPTAASANAELIIENYSDNEVIIESERLFLPSAIDVSLTVDNILVFRFDLNDVDYADNGDFEIPISVDLEIFLSPFTLTLQVERNSTTEFTLDLNFTDGANCNWGADVNVTLDNDDFENLTEDDITSVTATVRINDLSIQSLNGIAELIKLDDPSENDVNSLLDLEVLFNDVKIGDLRLDDENETVIIFYKDNTSEDTATFYEDFADEVEQLFTEFTGE